MSNPTLKALMSERPWEQDWPVQDSQARAAVHLPEKWRAGLDALFIGSDHLRSVDPVAHLLRGTPEAAPTVRQLRQVLDGFDKWNAWAEDHLTFPPSLAAFGAALAAGLSDKNTVLREQTQTVVCCYPELSWAALSASPALLEKVPASMLEHWRPAPVPVAPVVPAQAPAVPVTAAPSTAAPVTKPPAASRPAPREEAGHRARSYDHEARWVREKLLPVVRESQGNPSALVSQSLDEALRGHYNATRPTPWVEEVLLPALMGLKAGELKELMAYWPNSARYEVKNPVELVNQPLFWAQLRDAEPDSQRMLVHNVLPLVIQSDNWTTEDRLRMLRIMMAYAKNKQELFDQRLDLWQQWGGNLHEKGVLNKDRQAAQNEDEFGASSAAKSALDWMREQNVPLWNQWLARQPSESPHATVTAPAANPPRRPRPR